MVASTGILLLTIASSLGIEPTERLTVDDAVKIAIEISPAVEAARLRIDAAQAQGNSHRGRMLPSVNLSGEWQRWNDTFMLAFPLNLPAAAGGPIVLHIPARDQNTRTLVAAANQPVLGLLRLVYEQSALSANAEAAGWDHETVVANLTEDVQTQFLRLFEARALGGIARASQKQLAEQITVAKQKVAAGVLTDTDVLRLQVAMANARQQEIQAAAAEQVARASVLTRIGRPPLDESVDFIEPTTAENVEPLSAELIALVESAKKKRSEIRGATSQAGAARATARARLAQLLPEVDLEAGYLNMQGQAFAQPTSAYIGIKAGWQVWDWGADYYQSQAARAQASAAEAQLRDLQRGVELDVASQVANVQATGSALEAARTAITSAEEAFRVTTEMVKAGAASTTDLLDAEAALTQARLNFARARYEYAVAHVSLNRAVGGA